MDILCHLRPKPCLPFASNYRVIDFSLSNCINSGINDIFVLVDYQRAQMSQYLIAWHSINAGAANLLALAPQKGSYAGTADAVYQNLDFLFEHNSDTVLILAGDHVYKMDYLKMVDYHHAVNADVTVAVIRVPFEEIHRFGAVTINRENKIMDFTEKSPYSTSNLASMGIYVFKKDILKKCLCQDAMDTDSPHDFGYAILPHMVKTDRVFAYEFNGYWHDIGTVEAYYEANMELLMPKPQFSLNSDWSVFSQSSMLPICKANKEGNIINSMIGPGCAIKGRVENSVLSPGIYVGEEALIRNSVVMADAHIGYHSIVDQCILDEKVTIGELCFVGFGASLLSGDPEITVLGKDVNIPARTFIGRRSRIKPGLSLESLS